MFSQIIQILPFSFREHFNFGARYERIEKKKEQGVKGWAKAEPN
jgi:hypothetical protein